MANETNYLPSKWQFKTEDKRMNTNQMDDSGVIKIWVYKHLNYQNSTRSTIVNFDIF